MTRSFDTVAERDDALRNTLGSMAIEGMELDAPSLRLCRRWVRGEITLEELGSFFGDDIYANRPEARLP